jgi:hypothetical protein
MDWESGIELKEQFSCYYFTLHSSHTRMIFINLNSEAANGCDRTGTGRSSEFHAVKHNSCHRKNRIIVDNYRDT